MPGKPWAAASPAPHVNPHVRIAKTQNGRIRISHLQKLCAGTPEVLVASAGQRRAAQPIASRWRLTCPVLPCTDAIIGPARPDSLGRVRMTSGTSATADAPGPPARAIWWDEDFEPPRHRGEGVR